MEIHRCTYTSQVVAEYRNKEPIYDSRGKVKSLEYGAGICVWEHTCTVCEAVSYSTAHYLGDPPSKGIVRLPGASPMKLKTPPKRAPKKSVKKETSKEEEKFPPLPPVKRRRKRENPGEVHDLENTNVIRADSSV